MKGDGYRMGKVVVIGGSGFLGSHVCDKLSDEGHQVCVFDCVPSPWIRKDQKMFEGDCLLGTWLQHRH